MNNSFRHPIGFYTQITLNVAKDDEMLELLASANFFGMLIGIESPNLESLIETNKPQNYKTDIVADVKKIQSYGLPVETALIVGFDHDDSTIFDQHFKFLQDTCVPLPVLNILYAPLGTKLWVRLHKEGRVVDLSAGDGNSDDSFMLSFRSNIMPKQLTRVELLAGYRDLVTRVRDWGNFEARVKGMISELRYQPDIRRGLLPWNQGRRPART